MKIATAVIESVSPYSQSRMHGAPHAEKESAQAYENRTWREKCHANEAGYIIIPPMQFKNSLAEAAEFLGMKIKGRGQSTWSKHFRAGVLVTDPVVLPVKKEGIAGETFNMNADGKRGSGKRVPRTFPVVPQWKGTVQFYVIDDTIDEETFRYHLEQAGQFIGIGRFRPRNGGFYGRFRVASMKWEDGAKV